MEETQRETLGRVGTLVHDVKEKGSNILRGVKDKVVHGADVLSKKSLRELADDTKAYVKNNPGKVVVASFVVGILLGALVRGRNSNKA